MQYLLGVTLLWAFSFSLIGEFLAGNVDSWFSVWIRVTLAAVLFVPFLKFKGVRLSLIIKLMVIGGIQLGLMYCFYFPSFALLSVPEVLLFTVLTPVYVTLLYDLLKGRFSPWYLVSAALAVLGAIIIKYADVNANFLQGFLMVQGANICFAIGQVGYKYIQEKEPSNLPQHATFGYFYLGAFVVATIAFLILGNTQKLPTTTLQWGVLVYLGLIASGLGYFLWNKGACLVNAGALAVMNNALVPLGLVVNLVIWQKDVDLARLIIGGLVIVLSLWVNERWVKKPASC